MQFLKKSPQNTTQILIQRETQGKFLYFNFYLIDNFARKKKIFMTESWQSYSDMNWWPSLIWLNETKFITIGFYSDIEQSLPQSEGLFSIVQIDLNDFSKEILYTDLEIKPFPKFVLNPSLTDLYFQKAGKQSDSTELWKLDLAEKNAEMIYSVQGDLGEIRFSSDGSSFVFTQLLANNFDIIRIDLDRNHIRQLVGK
ncbi:MAG: hypothetical protein ACE5HX_08830 [bacterium]